LDEVGAAGFAIPLDDFFAGGKYHQTAVFINAGDLGGERWNREREQIEEREGLHVPEGGGAHLAPGWGVRLAGKMPALLEGVAHRVAFPFFSGWGSAR